MLQYTKYSKMKCSLTRTEICFQNNHYVLVECDKNRKDRNRDEGGRKPPRVGTKAWVGKIFDHQLLEIEKYKHMELFPQIASILSSIEVYLSSSVAELALGR